LFSDYEGRGWCCAKPSGLEKKKTKFNYKKGATVCRAKPPKEDGGDYL
jgi:hypothetical protein